MPKASKIVLHFPGEIPNCRKPFDMLALTNVAYQKRKAASRVKSGLSEIWLRRVDEFRNCFLIENIVATSPHFEAVETFSSKLGW